jgi:phosphatidylglycerophosphatase A
MNVEKDLKEDLAKTNLPEKPKTFTDKISLAIATFGVGYLPLAPGTYGSIAGVLIYLGIIEAETAGLKHFVEIGFEKTIVEAWFWVFILIIFLIFCFIGIKASTHVAHLLNNKDPQIIVVDEVMGQLLVFLFVPLLSSGWLIFAGFLFFRLFDIVKPYPINSLQNLPDGIGVCADDLLAGVYGGICLSILYAISLSV